MISAELLRPDGTAPSPAELADLQDAQAAVLTSHGVNTPMSGLTFVGLSTGKMRDVSAPDHVPPHPGTDLGHASSPPADYIASWGGELPDVFGCAVCPGGAGANDGVDLRLTIRVPTNAYSFSFSHRLFTAEAVARPCAAYADPFLALLTTGAPGIPADKNVVFDPLGYPVSANDWFTVCAAGLLPCNQCVDGPADLAGTGMPAAHPWLQADVPTLPGEVITLDLIVFDVSDGLGDTVVLLDDFIWNTDPPGFVCMK